MEIYLLVDLVLLENLDNDLIKTDTRGTSTIRYTYVPDRGIKNLH